MSSRSGFNKDAHQKCKPCCGWYWDRGKVSAEKGSNGCKCGPDYKCCSKSPEKINCKRCAALKLNFDVNVVTIALSRIKFE